MKKEATFPIRRCFLSLILTVLAITVQAQDLSTVAEARPQEVKLGTPEALTMVRDIQIPATYNTGTLNVQVPLHQFTYAGATVSVGLSYNTSGIKVDDDPTIVGLGWRLNAGGSIVRAVRGNYPDGYGCTKCTGMVSPNSSWTYSEFDTRMEDWYDTEPDLYYFTTPTCSGMFLLDEDSKVVQVPYQNLSITVNDDASGGYFVIRDYEGNEYVFGLSDNSKDISTQMKLKWIKEDAEFRTDSYEYISAWHLSHIRRKGVEVAQFYYEPADTPFTVESKSQTKTYWVPNTSNNNFEYIATNREAGKVDQNISKVVTEPNYLQSIVWPGGEMLFEVEDHALQRITIQDKLGEEYATDIEFGYGTFFNGLLKLESVYEIDPITGNTNHIAEFLYNERKVLLKDSRAHFDHFGYYNGSRGAVTYNVRHINGMYDVLSYVLTGKDPDLYYTQNNSLRKIIYPFGGYREFEYELNKASDPDYGLYGAMFTASGLRIRKITEKAYANATPAVTEFQYGTAVVSGFLNGVGTRSKHMPNYVTSLSRGSDGNLYYSVSNKCPVTLTDMDGTIVQYPIVWEILPDGSKNEYKYTSHDDFPDEPIQKRSALRSSDAWVDVEQGPIAPTTFHYMRGLLEEKSSYDNTGALVSREKSLHYLGDIKNSVDVILPTRGLVAGNRVDPNDIESDQYLFLKYKWYSQPILVEISETVGTKYSATSYTRYVYDSIYGVPTLTTRTDAEGNVYETYIRYPFDYWATDQDEFSPVIQGIKALQEAGRWAEPIETVTFRNGIAISGTIAIYTTDQALLSEIKYLPQIGISKEDYIFSYSSVLEDFVCDPHYKTDIICYDFDNQKRPLSFRKRNGEINSVVYDHAGNIIAYVENARHSLDPTLNTVFFSSFESVGNSNLYLGDYVGQTLAKSGDYVGKSSITIPISNQNEPYSVCYWRSTDNGATWTKNEYTVPGNSGNVTISASSSSWIDEVSVLPLDARINTVAYGSNYNKILSSTDPNGKTAYYFYDVFGRPHSTRDQDKNYVEMYELNF